MPAEEDWVVFAPGQAPRTLNRMSTDFETLVDRYHSQLPGLVRATLIDYGVSETCIERHQIGWDGRAITVPIRDQRGRLAFLERWNDQSGVGRPSTTERSVELFPWGAIDSAPSRLVFAEGIHEALVLESAGIPAIAATGSGLFFKTREWAPLLEEVEELVVAFRLGDQKPRGAFLLSRLEVVREVARAIPGAAVLTWPRDVGQNGGAFEYFVKLRRSVLEFEVLARRA